MTLTNGDGKCWCGQFFHSNFRGKARGTGILIGRNIPFESSNIKSDKDGRCIIVSAKLHKKSSWPTSTGLKLTLYNSLRDLSLISIVSLLFLVGIFNCYLDPVSDHSSLTLPLLEDLQLISNHFLLIIASLIHTGFYTQQEENIHSVHISTTPTPQYIYFC